LVGLAVGFVALFAIGFATSQDPQDYDSPATVMKNFDMSRPALTLLLAGGIFTGAVLVFFGAALKAALENRTRSWTTNVVGYGFTFGGVTMLIFSLASVWLYHAVDIGDASAVQAITIIDVGAFPALMMLFVTAYTSVGIAAYAGRSLPTWLCAVSVVLGVIAPISIGGFASFTLFPVWLIAVAAMVKLDPK
jgi:hypothetical protein